MDRPTARPVQTAVITHPNCNPFYKTASNPWKRNDPERPKNNIYMSDDSFFDGSRKTYSLSLWISGHPGVDLAASFNQLWIN